MVSAACSGLLLTFRQFGVKPFWSCTQPVKIRDHVRISSSLLKIPLMSDKTAIGLKLHCRHVRHFSVLTQQIDSHFNHCSSLYLLYLTLPQHHLMGTTATWSCLTDTICIFPHYKGCCEQSHKAQQLNFIKYLNLPIGFN